MINKKISTIAGSLIILAIVIAIVFTLFSNKGTDMQNQNNAVSDNSGLGNKEEIKQGEKKEIKGNDEFELSDNWTLISHYNFWNNPNVFKQHPYNFPNVEFYYPENWEFRCCGDMGHASEHFIYSSEYRDKSLPYIRITDYVLSGCPNSQSNCSLDKTIEISANEKFNRLKSNISSDEILPEKELKNLNTTAFVYKKTEKEGNFSTAYLINLKDDVIQVDFVNYGLLNDEFINNFLDRISSESK